jgi:hypothetical protein
VQVLTGALNMAIFVRQSSTCKAAKTFQSKMGAGALKICYPKIVT